MQSKYFTMNRQPLDASQKGLSLIELLIGVGILGLLLFLWLTQGDKIRGFFSSYGYNAQLATLKECVESQGKSRGNYTGLTALSLVQIRCAPENIINGNTLQSEFGAIVLAPANLDGGTNNAFNIGYNGVPPQECANMVTAQLDVYRVINIGGTAVKDDTTPDPAQTAIQAACANDRNDIEFIGR